MINRSVFQWHLYEQVLWPEVAEIGYDGVFGYPQDIAISRDNLRAYVTNRTAQLVSVIDLTTSRIIAYYMVAAILILLTGFVPALAVAQQGVINISSSPNPVGSGRGPWG